VAAAVVVKISRTSLSSTLCFHIIAMLMNAGFISFSLSSSFSSEISVGERADRRILLNEELATPCLRHHSSMMRSRQHPVALFARPEGRRRLFHDSPRVVQRRVVPCRV